jgi:heptosyltransferase-2
LRKRFPDAVIDFAVREKFTQLLETNPHLNALKVLKEPAGFNLLKGFASEIRRENYDLIVDIHRNLRSFYICFEAKSKVYRWSPPRFKRWLLVQFKINLLKNYPPVPLRYLSAVKGLGTEDDGKGLEFFISENKRKECNHIWEEGNLSGKTVSAIAPGSRWFTKRWPPQKFTHLAQQMLSHHCQTLIFLGSKQEYELCHTICHNIQGETLNLAGRTDLGLTGAILERCNFFIGNDSGLNHLASAVGTPSIMIFGPTVKEFGFFPFRSNSRVIEKTLPCRPCSHLGGEKCPQKHFRCMEEIEVEEVLAAVEALISK